MVHTSNQTVHYASSWGWISLHASAAALHGVAFSHSDPLSASMNICLDRTCKTDCRPSPHLIFMIWQKLEEKIRFLCLQTFHTMHPREIRG